MKTFKPHFEDASFAGQVVHSDLAGKFATSIHGAEYFFGFMYQYSKILHKVGLQTKDQVDQAIEGYKDLQIVKQYFKK